MLFVNPFDRSVIGFLNQFARRSRVFDAFVVLIDGENLLKGGFIMVLYWWEWFRQEEHQDRREYLLFTMIAGVFSIFVARTLGVVLPFRTRPVFDTTLAFRIPYNFNTYWLINWNSFPSDHAILFFCLSAGLWFVSRRLSLIAMAQTFFIITLPRVYLGIHFPTDIIGGGLLGIVIASTAQLSWLRESVTRYPKAWLQKYPEWFYSAMFAYSFETAELYRSALAVGRALWLGARRLL